MGGVLLLTNNRNALPLFDWLAERESVEIFSGPISREMLENLRPQWLVSYNYVHIIKRDALEFMQGRAANLHISLLPWNRGFSPNFWSFVEDAPKGVTLHVLEEGLDTGAVIAQREIFFDEEKETFRTSYERLNDEIKELFKENWESLKSGDYSARPQEGRGSYHSRRDLEDFTAGLDFSWDERIGDFKRRIGRK